jgi:hypothetical protein
VGRLPGPAERQSWEVHHKGHEGIHEGHEGTGDVSGIGVFFNIALKDRKSVV